MVHSHRRGSRSRLGTLFRRSNRYQKAAVTLCGLITVHGLYVLFVPAVQLDSDLGLRCPPAIVAAIAGTAGMPTLDDADVAAEHDAACASVGRRWALAAAGQIAVSVVWGWAILEWGRVVRRLRRRQRRERR